MRKNWTPAGIAVTSLLSIIMLVSLPAGIADASDGETPLAVDVWTDKGGQGQDVPGGTYEVGEETTIYLEASSNCQASWIISGPSIGYPGQLVDAVLEAGEIYEWSLGQAEEADIGQWQITFDACTDGQCASDTTWFTVIQAEPPPVPLTVDVWTDKGGRGASMPGGIYEVGEETTIYLEASSNCQASWIISGPSIGYPGQLVDAVLEAGEIYEWSLGQAEEADIGQWQITFDACTDGQCASDTTWFTVIQAEPPPVPLTVDVWTDKGGRGPSMPGGIYEVGENITLWIKISTTCQATWTLSGPPGTDSGEQVLDAGTYALSLGWAEKADIGLWQIAFEVWTNGQYASDTTWFTIIGAEPEPQPEPEPEPPAQPPPLTLTPTPSEPEEEPTVRIAASDATELQALIALKMAEGSLPVDLTMDADGDGQVTKEDARLILKWAVNLIQ